MKPTHFLYLCLKNRKTCLYFNLLENIERQEIEFKVSHKLYNTKTMFFFKKKKFRVLGLGSSRLVDILHFDSKTTVSENRPTIPIGMRLLVGKKTLSMLLI